MSTIQLAVDGIVYGSIIVLGAIGLSLVYSIGDFPNFAHGDLMVTGAYGGLVANLGLTRAGIEPESVFSVTLLVTIAAGLVVGIVVAVSTYYLVFKPIDSGPIALLITSFGVALIYRSLIWMSFGSSAQSYNFPRSGPLGPIREATGLAITSRMLVILVVTGLVVTALHFVLQYSMLGKKMRAAADNQDLARISGIRPRETVLTMWVGGGGLAALGGIFLGLNTLVRPMMGFDILLVVFAAVILGGIGSIYGAMLGGFAIGLAHEMSPVIPGVGAEYGAAVAFVIMIAILLVKPSGILGEATT